jgi:4-hydroxybenzoate polyprenyltransferase
MRYEFFAAALLKKHQVWYIISHMAIIPLTDVYASSYDWKLKGMAAPGGLIFFLGVSYLNGMILEVGRKLRVPETEEYGVVSYTRLWGQRTAVVIWLCLLAANFALACFAESYAHDSTIGYTVLGSIFAVSTIPALLFLVKPGKVKTRMIELMSVVWALAMYLTLGGIPLLLKLTGFGN